MSFSNGLGELGLGEMRGHPSNTCIQSPESSLRVRQTRLPTLTVARQLFHLITFLVRLRTEMDNACVMCHGLNV